MTNLTPAHHVASATLPVVDHISFLGRILLAGAATGGALSVVEERGRLGCMTPRHVHDREAETFVVLDGALEAWSEAGLRLVEAGELIHLPARQEHAFRVASATARFYMVITPAGFESFFEETGVPVDVPFDGELPVPAPPTPEEAEALARGAAVHGCTVLGPPPFGTATDGLPG